MKILVKYRTLISAIFLSVITALVLIFFNLQSNGEADVHRSQMSLSARQRMLTQRILRTLLEMSTAPMLAPEQRRYQKRLESDAVEFDRVLRVLAHGYQGADDLDDHIELPPLSANAEAAAALNRAFALWADYFPLLQTLGTSFDVATPKLTHAKSFALEHSDDLQDLMDQLTRQIALHSREDLRSMWTLQACLAALVFALGALQILVIRRIRLAEDTEKTRLQDEATDLELELQRNTVQLRDLMVVSPDLVWTKDTVGLYQACNQAYLEFNGRAAVDLVGRNALDLYEAQQSDVERARDAKMMTAGQSVHTEAKLTSAHSGAVGLFEIVRTPLFHGDGRSAGVQSVARDISLRRNAEEAAAVSRQRLVLFEKCIENLNDAILITEAEPRDAPGPRIVFANHAFERMTGFSAQEVLGKSPRMLQGPATDKRELARMHAALLAWRSERMEVINYAKDGREFWVEMAVTPITDGSNGDWYTHFVAVQRDVTERKRNALKLEQLYAQANETSRLKSSFLATVSHEIRTPMNGVIGISRILGDTVLDQEQREYVGMISQSADALMVIINDILDFSKIESGHMRIETQQFELGPVIDACATLMVPVAEQKQISLHITKAPDAPRFMHSDPGRLRQILLNLLGNAIKFTPSGGIELVLYPTTTPAGLAALRFEVRDSGIGIPLEQQQRLFQPFQQVDGTHTRKYGGTGLGLAICRQLVERMHGQIGVESAPEVGSMFWFELPVAPTSDPAMKET